FPGSGSASSIRLKLGMLGRPTGLGNVGDAVKRAYTDGQLDDPARSNFILLITNGNTNCHPTEPKYTLDEIKNAAARNPPVRTVVLAFAPKGVPMLNMWARAGGAPRNGGACGGANQPDCYYSGTEFAAAFDATEPAGAPCGCDDTCLGVGCPLGKQCFIQMP